MNDNGTHSHSQKFDESAQPREIKRNKGNQVPNRISITPTSLPPSRSSRHRRTHSSDERILPPGEFLPPPYGVYQNPPPLYNVPQAMQYSPRIPQGAPRPRRTPPTNNFSATDRSRERPSHVRSRSWNEEQLQMQGLSTSGNPLIPVLHDMGQNSFTRGMPSPRQQGRQHRIYQEATGRPRESKNLREMMPYEIAQQDVPPPSIHMSSPRPRPEHWSPRTEIMTIAKGFHSKNYSPPISPNANATNTGFRTVSPRISPNNPSFSSAHISPSIGSIHAQYGSHDLMDRPLTSSGSYRSLHAWQPKLDHSYTRESDVLLPNVGNPPGGTADEPLGESSRSRSKRFSRKMQHMRQKSAQLFMENYRGTPQPTSCRDVLFVLLFLFHLAGMTLLGKLYGSEATQGDQAVTLSYRNVVYMSCICGAFAVVVSTITLIIMMSITKKIIQFSLFLSITLSFAWGTIGIGLSPKNFVPITGIIALALSVGYAFVVWDRIPFASSNLHAGLSAIRANMGTVLVAFLCQGIALGWTVYYTFVVVGVYDALKVGDLVLTKNMRIFVFTMLGISFYWTFHVLMNIVQVTVAATLGCWWFRPDADHSYVWNSSTCHSFLSAVFYSIGSICFGSLFVGPVRLVRQLSAFVRPAQEDSILLCLHQFVTCVQRCMSDCVDSLSDHFNPWALTYVGLYGYGFLDAGRNATELFRRRGWTTIVSDDLVANVLLMFGIVVGGVTGCFGVLMQRIDNLEFSSYHEPTVTAFIIGLGIGVVLTSVLFAIITSSVNAVIVCFAGSPLEFEQNHPDLSSEMCSAWREVWPGCMDHIETRYGYHNQEQIRSSGIS